MTCIRDIQIRDIYTYTCIMCEIRADLSVRCVLSVKCKQAAT